jgi:hypothetical protein
LALGGRRFININNNQMEDGINIRGCVGEEARPSWNVWGGRLPIVWRRDINRRKKNQMGGPLALDGRRLMGDTTTNQKLASTVEGALKRKGNRGRTCGGVLSLCLERRIDEEKKTTTKIRRGLRGPPTNENHTATNQKHAGATKEAKEGSCDRQGERGGRANQSFGGD